MSKEFEGNELFPVEKKGYEKAAVESYIDGLKKSYERKIAELESKYEALREKNEKITEDYIVLQNQKSEVASLLINAEAKAADIIEKAKADADEECRKLDVLAEEKRREIVAENEKLRNLKIETEKVFEAFNASLKESVEKAKADADALYINISENMEKICDKFEVPQGEE